MTASTVPIPYIDATGYHLPAFADVLAAHKADYAGNYGLAKADLSDVADQDVEWVTIEALAFQETFALGLAIYNSFSPVTAQGTGLSSVVKVNGITRAVASYSTATVTVIGQAGTVLVNQTATDGTNTWSLPSPILIPFSGTIDVTATCLTTGAIVAPSGALSPGFITRGLQSIANANPGTPGQPIETDPQLRVRQAQSTMLPALGVLEGIQGAILALPGVARLRIYENDTSATDANGIPGHTIAAVVDGGDGLAICTAIAKRKTPGAGTFGSASQIVTNAYGVPRQINYLRPSLRTITALVKVRAFSAYTLDDEAAIKQAVSDWINALGIGQSVLVKRIYGPALMLGTASATRFELLSVAIGEDGAATQEADITIAFDEAATTVPANIGVGYA